MPADRQPVLSSFRAFARVLPLPPEGGGAPETAQNNGAPSFEGAPPAACAAGAPSGAPPRRFVTRSPYFFAGPKGSSHSRDPGGVRAAVHPTSPSHSRRPPHRGRTVTAPPGTGLRSPPAGAAIPAPPTGRHRKTPSVSADGVHHM